MLLPAETSYPAASDVPPGSDPEPEADPDDAGHLAALRAVSKFWLHLPIGKPLKKNGPGTKGGSRAFFRLQKEILGITHDQSILAIASYEGGYTEGALASSPDQFRHGGNIHFRPFSTRVAKANVTTDMTKLGVSVELLLAAEMIPPDGDRVSWFRILNLQMGSNPLARPGILLRQIGEADNSVFVREGGRFVLSPVHPNLAEVEYADCIPILVQSS